MGFLRLLIKKFGVERNALNLPEYVSTRPKIDILLEKQGELLKITPSIAYGSPIAARLIGEQLHVLDSKVPSRNEDEERKFIDRIYRQLGLDFDKSIFYRGEKAVEFVKILHLECGSLSGSGLAAYSFHGPLDAKFNIKDDGFNLTLKEVTRQKRKSKDI